MSTLRWLKNSITGYDMFGYGFGVRFEKNKGTNYPTAWGGFVSIFLKIVVLYVLFTDFTKMYYYKSKITSNIRGTN